MMKTNKATFKLWGQRFGATVLAAMLIGSLGGSVVAQGQFIEQASADSYQSNQYVPHYGCDGCQANYSSGGSHLRVSTGRIGNLVSGVKQNAALLSHRETPPGNMGLHFPYDAAQMYYYRRPYNDFHVPRHLAESKDGPAQSSFGPSLGYSTEVFEQAHKSTEVYFNGQGIELEKDGLLEFVDWKDHQQRRQIWESTPRYRSEQRNNSYPSLDEEVLNKNSNGRPDAQLGRTIRYQRNEIPNRHQSNVAPRARYSQSQSNAPLYERQ